MMHKKSAIITAAAVLLIAVVSFSVTETAESDIFDNALTINEVSLKITDGKGEWSVSASGWEGTIPITYLIVCNDEIVFDTQSNQAPNTEYRFSSGDLNIWKGTEYMVIVSADEYLPDYKTYTTLSSIQIIGSSSMEVGDKNALSIRSEPTSSSCKDVVWSVSDKTKAKMNGCVIEALDIGTVYVKATSVEDSKIISSEFKITIEESSITSGYRIVVTTDEGGTAEADKSRAFPGEWVKLEQDADYGYEFVGWESNTTITVIGDYSAFEMPEYAVKIKAVFRQTYPADMTIRETEHGTVLIPINALKSKGMYDDDNLKVRINFATEIPPNIPASATTYTVSITYNGIEATSFSELITIMLDYKNKDSTTPHVYSVSADGTEVYKLDGEYNQDLEEITFQTGKITLFCISEVPIESIIKTDSNKPTFIFVIAGFIIILIAVVIFIKR